MADEPAVVETPVPAATPEPAPVVEAASEPVVTAPETVEPVAEAAATETPAAEAEAKPAEKPEAETLLGKKPEETVAEVEAKTEEAEPPAPVEPEPVTYEAFTFPEGATPDEEKLAAFTELASKHRIPQEEAQRLIDTYIDGQQKLIDRMAEYQQTVWRETNENWIAEIKKDREIGGNRLETVLARCSDIVDRFASSSRDAAVRATAQTQLRDALNVTGAGNHPAIVRFLSNVAEALAPPQPVIAPRPMPVAAPSKATRRYSNGNGAHA